jgi:beta-galactosidase
MRGLAFAVVLAIAGSVFAADQPRVRETMDWDWRFFLGDPAGAQAVGFDDGAWQKVDLPHDWSISLPFDQNAPAGGSGGYLPTGIGWYRKTFPVADSYRNKEVFIEFDGIYQRSEVWINGHSLGQRPSGYISLIYNLTPYLNFGKDNILAIRADNSHQPNSRWYSGSGIDRHTWLIVTDPLHIPQWGTYVTTPTVTADTATVNVVTTVANDRSAAANFTLHTSILDRDGKEIQSADIVGSANANGNTELTQAIKVSDPTLWSLDNPYLYTVRTQVREGSNVVDQYDTTVGIRTIAFDVDRGFLLNGQHVKLNGVCLHNDGGSVGAAVPEGVWQRRLQLLKDMGCNAIRTSHNPPTPELLDLCDRMGFCVMDEAFDVWEIAKPSAPQGYQHFFDQWSQRDLTDFITRDRNHPCVVLWSVGNEIGEQISRTGPTVLKPLVDTTHRLDPTRPVTAACDDAYAEPRRALPDFLALLDVVGYNYADRWRDRAQTYYEDDRAAYPKRLFVGTESVSMGGTRGDYSYLFQRPTTVPAVLPTTFPTGRFGRRGGGAGVFGRASTNRRVDVEQLWEFVASHDYVSGDFMWTGIDYIGEAFWPTKNATSGILDTCGFPKDGYYFYQSQWTTKPVLHAFPHWNWPGKEGQIIPVTCYTNCDTVELFVNGKSYGVKGYEFPREGMEGRYGNEPPRALAIRTTSDLHLSWDVPYEPGTLHFVGTTNGKTVVTEDVVTAGEPAAILLTADKSTLAADGRDVSHLTVQIVDGKGNIVPTADNDVTFTIQGEGKIIGVDNGDPASHESYKADHRKTFNGLALAIVQTTQNAGAIHITAASPGLSRASVDLMSK